jgi:hypothetical protein
VEAWFRNASLKN